MLTPELLNILACPVCKGNLAALKESSYLLCLHCGLNYNTRDGIPIMLIDTAEQSPE